MFPKELLNQKIITVLSNILQPFSSCGVYISVKRFISQAYAYLKFILFHLVISNLRIKLRIDEEIKR